MILSSVSLMSPTLSRQLRSANTLSSQICLIFMTVPFWMKKKSLPLVQVSLVVQQYISPFSKNCLYYSQSYCEICTSWDGFSLQSRKKLQFLFLSLICFLKRSFIYSRLASASTQEISYSLGLLQVLLQLSFWSLPTAALTPSISTLLLTSRFVKISYWSTSWSSISVGYNGYYTGLS